LNRTLNIARFRDSRIEGEVDGNSYFLDFPEMPKSVAWKINQK
jgi:hypothetical protein